MYRRWDAIGSSAGTKWRNGATKQPGTRGTASDLRRSGSSLLVLEVVVRIRAPRIQLLLLVVVILLLILVHAVPASPDPARTTVGLRSGTGSPDTPTTSRFAGETGKGD